MWITPGWLINPSSFTTIHTSFTAKLQHLFHTKAHLCGHQVASGFSGWGSDHVIKSDLLQWSIWLRLISSFSKFSRCTFDPFLCSIVLGYALCLSGGVNNYKKTDKWGCVCCSLISADKLMTPASVIKVQEEQIDFFNCEQTQKRHVAVWY